MELDRTRKNAGGDETTRPARAPAHPIRGPAPHAARAYCQGAPAIRLGVGTAIKAKPANESERSGQIGRTNLPGGPASMSPEPLIAEAIRSPGQPLDRETRATMESRFGLDFAFARVHTDSRAAESASQMGALAYAVGKDIVFGPGRYKPETQSGKRLLTHELAHVVQQGGLATSAPSEAGASRVVHDPSLEQNADQWADNLRAGDAPALPMPRSAPAVMPSVAEVVLKFAARRLGRRSIATISKHVARHARRMAGRALHGVFKYPKRIRTLVQGAVKDATALAAKNASAPAERVLEEAGVRIVRQTTGTPGKFRWMIQKQFSEAIGTKGERILRIIIDQTGRIVTAFPADRLAAIGLTAAGVTVLTEQLAQAGGVVRERAQRAAKAQEERENRIDFWEFIPIIGDIWGGSLNEGEYEELADERAMSQLVEGAIAAVETSERRSLSGPEREELAELVRAAITSPLVAEESE